MSVAIIDYGLGNLASVRGALNELGAEPFLATDPGALAGATHLVLPGVGSFAEGMQRLRDGGWVPALDRAVNGEGRALLGVCLGMQLLASSGREGGLTEGLGFVHGEVRHLSDAGCELRVPHVGWNEVAHDGGDAAFAGIPDRMDFYFVHSYALTGVAEEHVVGTTDYGISIPAVIRHGRVLGAQFHPEKSSWVGRRLLENFLGDGPC